MTCPHSFDLAMLVLTISLTVGVVIAIWQTARRGRVQVIPALRPTGIYWLDNDAHRELDFVELEQHTEWLRRRGLTHPGWTSTAIH